MRTKTNKKACVTLSATRVTHIVEIIAVYFQNHVKHVEQGTVCNKKNFRMLNRVIFTIMCFRTLRLKTRKQKLEATA